MRTSGPGYSATTLTLLLLSIAFACGAIAGVSQGWALAMKSDFHEFGPFSPPVDIKVQLGWWNATTSIAVKGAGGVHMETKAAKSLGLITVLLFISSMVLSLYFLSLLFAEYCCVAVIDGLEVNKRRKFMVALLCTVLLYMFSVGLYLALALGLDHEISKKFEGQHVFARPDWSFLCGILGASCWAGVTSVFASTMAYSNNLYYPLDP